MKVWYNDRMNNVKRIGKPLSEKQQKLVSRNIGLLDKYYEKEIEKGEIPQGYEQEFYSILQERFCISAREFDEETGFKFSTFAHGGMVFGKEFIIQSVQKRESLGVPSFERLVIQHEKVAEFIDTVELPEREREALDLHFNDNLSFNKAGKIMGVSGETVRTLVAKAIERIRKAAVKEGCEKRDFIEGCV